MTQYCKCAACTKLRKQIKVHGKAGEPEKAKSILPTYQNKVFVHFSNADISDSLKSTEIVRLAENKYCVGLFTYMYNAGAKIPPSGPKSLQALGILRADPYIYKINSNLLEGFDEVAVYTFDDGTPPQCVIAIGCGGYIDVGALDGKTRTATNLTVGSLTAEPPRVFCTIL